MYTINITGHHIDVTPAIKDHINEKMGKIAKLSDQITSVNITLVKDNKEQKAEATIHLPGKELFAAASSEDRLFHAIDGMIDKLARQVDKHKTKQSATNHKAAVAS
ncbi:ribosome-associated translation inhibitor RaiA [Maribrevibacterium harenarium]|uniref:Ribosome hibernation promoting factor n=1 Tax=Maribrevibacterium harenarium TaxID=2589817 RepID=A0A501WTY4_9GAMM|nr:ribosome-associated translation inhibitor RaiA [Maribrevibacterium harenarium]TPE49306.1 ribosome-associated translation inhibitor RaiA [Maribrevibacterium harenarium]